MKGITVKNPVRPPVPPARLPYTDPDFATIVYLWSEGMDTADIARKIGHYECIVANTLHWHKEGKRQKRQGSKRPRPYVRRSPPDIDEAMRNVRAQEGRRACRHFA